MATEFLVQEEDGTSLIVLEDDSGFILLEESDSEVATDTARGRFRRNGRR